MRHTIPHRLPFSVVSKLHFEESWVKYIMILLVIMDDMAPAEAAIMVQTQATPMASASPGWEILAWDPALKAKNPNIKIKPPNAVNYKIHQFGKKLICGKNHLCSHYVPKHSSTERYCNLIY